MNAPSANSPSSTRLVTTRHGIRRAVADARARGQTIGLAPTMGAIHAGHLSLVEASRRECDVTIVTIFVNPTQFGPHEDFAKYPRTLDADLEQLRAAGVDLVFAPAKDEMYPPGHTAYVDAGAVAEPLEGVCRPGHFRGVATIVLKLFNLIPADVAYFGQKDYQQSLVIRRMVADLDLPIRIQVCPIVREPDRLALSSRNVYLDPDRRRRALALSHSLRLADELVRSGVRDGAAILDRMREPLIAAGIDRIDYIALADPETLAPVTQIAGPTVALIAAYVGATRLIDNRILAAADPPEGR
jgi:pantoate--beta-alanine ligase